MTRKYTRAGGGSCTWEPGSLETDEGRDFKKASLQRIDKTEDGGGFVLLEAGEWSLNSERFLATSPMSSNLSSGKFLCSELQHPTGKHSIGNYAVSPEHSIFPSSYFFR